MSKSNEYGFIIDTKLVKLPTLRGTVLASKYRYVYTPKSAKTFFDTFLDSECGEEHVFSLVNQC